ncbi:GGDEF domain-containing protein [Desulfogranum mediterraneum]|uniref:GGDEF domain-containing protein n=1 Tax=Desulfogranum mediterraneum TaxID=160661 RepID=UPI000685446C|nr:sensor domain-containing diguanylate cyclase [Desulfogranum mediterraneum]
MMAFGLAIGTVFPFFIVLLGVPAQIAFTPTFFSACISAGLIAGLVNYSISRKVVGERLQTLSRVGQQMRTLAQNMRSEQDLSSNSMPASVAELKDLCGERGCHIKVDSDDEFGKSAEAFNLLAETLSLTISTERAAHSFSNMLSNHLDLEPLAKVAIRQLMEFTDSTGGLLAVVDQGLLKLAACEVIANGDEVIQSSLIKEAVNSRKRQLINLPEDCLITVDHVVGTHQARHIIVEPAIYKGVALGVMVLVAEQAYGQEILHRLTMFRLDLGLALNNSLTHGRMRVLATLDPLTEIYNRGFGLKRLHEEYSRAVRADTPIGLIIFDIDDFKQINDTYGHLLGDRVLVSVVKSARRMLREGDILIRYGGEEFLVILPGANLDDVGQVAERIRRAVADMTIMEGEHAIRQTISLGGVSHPHLNVSHEEILVRHADASLYYAKRSGKNRVELDRNPLH